MDALLQRLKGREGTNVGTGTDSSPRFLVIKQSWRGQYPRILSISHKAITTRFPDTDDVTNTWSLTGDADVLGIEVGGASPEGGLFTIKISQRKVRGWLFGERTWGGYVHWRVTTGTECVPLTIFLLISWPPALCRARMRALHAKHAPRCSRCFTRPSALRGCSTHLPSNFRKLLFACVLPGVKFRVL